MSSFGQSGAKSRWSSAVVAPQRITLGRSNVSEATTLMAGAVSASVPAIAINFRFIGTPAEFATFVDFYICSECASGSRIEAGLAIRPRVGRTGRPCCEPTAPTATEASSRPRRARFRQGATWIDLEEPTREEERWSSRSSASTCRPRRNSPKSSRRAACSNATARCT